jgi:hypothetical protein
VHRRRIENCSHQDFSINAAKPAPSRARLTSSIRLSRLHPPPDVKFPRGSDPAGSPDPDWPGSPPHSLLAPCVGRGQDSPNDDPPDSPTAVVDKKMYAFKGVHSSNSR